MEKDLNNGKPSDAADPLLEQAFAEYTDAWVDGKSPDMEAFCRNYPSCAKELQGRIEEFLFVAQGLRGSGDSADKAKSATDFSMDLESVHGKVLGDFRILQEIGRGGMGVVYEAEQISLKRIVAVKVLPAHLTLRQESVVRFQREAATAARLCHPGIVEIYAVGEDDGTHFFAMELVEGAPLNDVIGRLESSPEQPSTGQDLSQAVTTGLQRKSRSDSQSMEESSRESHSKFFRKNYIESVCRLVIKVAGALDYAHTEGVIHRDVKPSNIIICEDGRTVLTDFGLAREEGLPSITITGEFAGTPYYISPEQAVPRRMKVDHRTDIYSLGVTLYELLTLKRPFEGRTSQEILGKIISREPPLLRNQNPLIPKDLETICLTAMEKNPARRYQRIADLATDLQNFLEFRPIHAHPVGMVSRSFRMVRRNPAISLIIGLLILIVVGGPIFFGIQQKVANIKIREEVKTTREVCDYLMNLFKVVEPSEARGRAITVFELLQQSAELAQARFAQKPAVQARVMEELGQVYMALGLYTKAHPLMVQAVAGYRRTGREDEPVALKALNNLGTLYRLMGRYKEAEPLFREAYDLSRKVLGEDHRDTLAVMNDMAMLFRVQNRHEEAEELYRATLDRRRRLLGDEHLETLESMNNLAYLLMQQGRFEQAEPLYSQSLKGRCEAFGEDHPDSLTSLTNLAVLYRKQRRFSEAIPMYIQSLEGREKVLGRDHPDTITSRFKLALCYLDQGRVKKAEPLCLQAYEDRCRILTEEHPKTLSALTFTGIIHHNQGRFVEAEAAYQKALASQERILDTGHNNTLFTMMNLARLYFDCGRFDRALPLARDVLNRTRANDPDLGERKALLEAINKKLKQGD